VNYERNKKGARFFETQCSILYNSILSYKSKYMTYAQISYNH